MTKVIDRDELRGLEVVTFVGGRFGVSTHNESLLGPDGWVSEAAPDQYYQDNRNYRGWTTPSRLCCRTCWQVIHGIPRAIVLANKCPHCSTRLYPADDAAWLDMVGYDLYRERVIRYMSIAVRRLKYLIEGHVHLTTKGVKPGFEKDHIFSVRDGFELDVPEFVISSPPNLRIVRSLMNRSKSRNSLISREELLLRYEQFLADNPRWIALVRESDAKQPLYIIER